MAAREPDLFNYEPPAHYPETPGFKEPTTSQEAAVAIEPVARTLRAQVLAAYKTVWPAGLTADEVAEKLNRSILSIRPRVTELEKLGELTKTTLRRKNASGLNAVVLCSKRPQ